MDGGVVTRRDIVEGLGRIGIRPGDRVLVHAAIASFGHVDGGVEAVIDALRDAVGPSGTRLFPTFACSDPVFDPATSETALGVLPSAAWKRPGAVRSRHPLASVAAIGPDAEDLVRGHEEAELAHGEGTPYVRLAERGGKIVLLGVDQDRSTFLHAMEELARAAYLKPASGSYRTASGSVEERTWPYFPGPHRNFIGLQSWIESQGLTSKTLIGSALCQAMPARGLMDAVSARMAREPGLFLSGNPNLPDGVQQNADILRAALARERFSTAADSAFAGRAMEECIDNSLRFGIGTVLLSVVNGTPWERVAEHRRRWYLDGLELAGLAVAALRLVRADPAEAVRLAREARTARVVVPSTWPTARIAETARALDASGARLCVENLGVGGADMVRMIDSLQMDGARVEAAFNPLAFVLAGENPFLASYSRTHIKARIGLLYLNDGLATGERTPLEEGLAEVKEMLSILRCRGFSGAVALQAPHPAGFPAAAGKLHSMLEELGSWPAV